VIHKQNGGLGSARNAGMDMALGQYITFVDSDDWIGEDHIEKLYLALKENDADGALGNHTRAWSDGKQSVKLLALEEKVYEGEDIVENILLPLFGTSLSSQRDVQINSSVSMNLYRLDLIRDNQIRFVNEKEIIAEDFHFNIEYFHIARRLVYTKEAGYFYFQNSNSISNRYSPHRFQRTLNYYAAAKDKIMRFGLENRAEFRLERSFLMKIRVAVRHIVMSDLTRKEKFQLIDLILRNETVRKALMDYPIEHYTFSMTMLFRLMRLRNVWGVYLLMLMREKGRQSTAGKKFLHWIGIGR
jgi:glycosyltransferase involved in cell wall biosynthesis